MRLAKVLLLSVQVAIFLAEEGGPNVRVGNYENHEYDNGGKNDWHYVAITKEIDGNYKWTNKAGVSWSLYVTNKQDVLSVGEDCPYYANGYTEAIFNADGVYGPWNEFYQFKVSVGNCADVNYSCGWWASAGECQKNPEYMRNHCKESCGLCGFDPPAGFGPDTKGVPSCNATWMKECDGIRDCMDGSDEDNCACNVGFQLSSDESKCTSLGCRVGFQPSSDGGCISLHCKDGSDEEIFGGSDSGIVTKTRLAPAEQAKLIAEQAKLQLKLFFSIIDTNNDNMIDLVEWIKHSSPKNPCIEANKLQKQFNEDDTDHNGIIDFKEFQRIVFKGFSNPKPFKCKTIQVAFKDIAEKGGNAKEIDIYNQAEKFHFFQYLESLDIEDNGCLEKLKNIVIGKTGKIDSLKFGSSFLFYYR